MAGLSKALGEAGNRNGVRMAAMPGRWADPIIGLKVSDCGSSIIVHACSPGLSEDNVQILVDGNLLTIRTESVDRSKLTSEARFGGGQTMPVPARFILTRSISLPAPVEESAECANCEDGGIDITLRKSAMPQAGSAIHLVRARAR